MTEDRRFERATEALVSHVTGDGRAVDRLVPLVYRELKRLARVFMRGERPGHTLSPTALVHEAYVRLVDNKRIDWQGKTHFLAIAAREMRQILIQHARARGAQKRGGGLARVTLSEGLAVTPDGVVDVVALGEAMENLEALSPRQCRVVELRFFGGLSVAETAYALHVSERTVKEDWRMARTWLTRELSGADGH